MQTSFTGGEDKRYFVGEYPSYRLFPCKSLCRWRRKGLLRLIIERSLVRVQSCPKGHVAQQVRALTYLFRLFLGNSIYGHGGVGERYFALGAWRRAERLRTYVLFPLVPQPTQS